MHLNLISEILPTTRKKLSRETVAVWEFWMQLQKMFGPIALSGHGVEAGP